MYSPLHHCATLLTMSDSESTPPPQQAPHAPPPPRDEPPIDQAASRDGADDATPAGPITDTGDDLNIDQAATYAGRAAATLRRVIRQGKLPRRYRPGLYGPELVFTRADIDGWLIEQARAVEAMPPAAASGSDRDVAATDEARATSTAVQSGDTMDTPVRLYALVALAYAQRLHSVEERLAAIEEHVRSQLEAQPQQEQQQPATTGPDHRLHPDELAPQRAAVVPDTPEERHGRPSLFARFFGRRR